MKDGGGAMDCWVYDETHEGVIKNGPMVRDGGVLIVDDDTAYGPLAVRFLEQRGGIRSTWVADGLSALRAARARPPNLLLLDISMPRYGGFHVLRALRADRRTARTPVVVVTCLPDPGLGLASAADALRANAFFSKVWGWSAYVNMVRHHLNAPAPATRDLEMYEGDFKIKMPARCVSVAGRKFFFKSDRCLMLLAVLLDAKEPVIAERLLRDVWPRGESVSVVAVTVHRLRKEMAELGMPVTVVCREGGYCLGPARGAGGEGDADEGLHGVIDRGRLGGIIWEASSSGGPPSLPPRQPVLHRGRLEVVVVTDRTADTCL